MLRRTLLQRRFPRLATAEATQARLIRCTKYVLLQLPSYLSNESNLVRANDFDPHHMTLSWSHHARMFYCPYHVFQVLNYLITELLFTSHELIRDPHTE